jgi:hypothetical protein
VRGALAGQTWRPKMIKVIKVIIVLRVITLATLTLLTITLAPEVWTDPFGEVVRSR